MTSRPVPTLNVFWSHASGVYTFIFVQESLFKWSIMPPCSSFQWQLVILGLASVRTSWDIFSSSNDVRKTLFSSQQRKMTNCEIFFTYSCRRCLFHTDRNTEAIWDRSQSNAQQPSSKEHIPTTFRLFHWVSLHTRPVPSSWKHTVHNTRIVQSNLCRTRRRTNEFQSRKVKVF